MKSDEYYINEAIKQARKCSASEDVPVGAVIVQGGKIIARGYNQVEKRNNSTAHAEIIAIERAIKKVGYKHLLDCDIYVTLEPCPMCSGAIVLARLRRLVFGAFDPKAGAAASLCDHVAAPGRAGASRSRCRAGACGASGTQRFSAAGRGRGL